MFDVIFYNYTGLPNKLDKELTDGTTFSCNFNIAYNEINPKIKIVLPECNYNYCYISATNKYYFIDNIEIRRNNFFELSLTEDVLMTYKDYIKTLYGTVKQSKTAYYYQGANFPVNSEYKMKSYKFENNPYKTDGNFILIATGAV